MDKITSDERWEQHKRCTPNYFISMDSTRRADYEAGYKKGSEEIVKALLDADREGTLLQAVEAILGRPLNYQPVQQVVTFDDKMDGTWVPVSVETHVLPNLKRSSATQEQKEEDEFETEGQAKIE